MKTTLQARIEKCRGSARFSQEVQELLLRECELAEEKLSAQESELTKLRKRVDVLTTALESVYPACSGYIPCEDGWEYNYGTDRLVKLVVDVRDALSESAKIAGRDE